MEIKCVVPVRGGLVENSGMLDITTTQRSSQPQSRVVPVRGGLSTGMSSQWDKHTQHRGVLNLKAVLPKLRKGE